MTLLALAVGGRGVVDPAEPVLRADDEALLRGRAAFETLRVYGGRPFRLGEHLDRLAGSAERIGLPDVEPRRARGARRGTRSTPPATPDAVLRLFWTPAPVARLGARERARRTLEALRERGQRLVSLLGVRAEAPWLLPGVKSTSYAVNMAAEAEARRRGADDAVFVDATGIVLEGPVTNVWWRRGRHALHAVARPRHPRRRDARGGARARAAARVRVDEGTFPLDELARRRRGVHVVVGARADARGRARRDARSRRGAAPPTSSRPRSAGAGATRPERLRRRYLTA